jgi:hypothetical protein
MKDLLAKPYLIFKLIIPEDLITETSISEEDEMSVEYLFRTYNEMPKLEQKPCNLRENSRCRLWRKAIVCIYKTKEILRFIPLIFLKCNRSL